MMKPTTQISKKLRCRCAFPLLLLFLLGAAFAIPLYNLWIIQRVSVSTNTNAYYYYEEAKPKVEDNYYYIYVEPKPTFMYNQSWPRIALFLTYPNSGTTFTLDTVAMLSGYDTGTNYNGEVYDGLEKIFNHTQGGPFWSNGTGIRHVPATKSFILTKTHCGGFCYDCGANTSIIYFPEFDNSCRSDVSGGILTPYDRSMVLRIVRIIRDPMSNIVSRFHHARSTQLNTHLRNFYMDNRTGFVRFCQSYRKKYRAEEDLTFKTNLTQYFDDIPCAIEFFRYVQWHNHANALVHEYKVPSLLLYYERLNYQNMETLLLFLNLKSRDLRKEDVKNDWKSYLDYYTNEEKVKIWTMIKMLASNETMKSLEPYLNGLDNFQQRNS